MSSFTFFNLFSSLNVSKKDALSEYIKIPCQYVPEISQNYTQGSTFRLFEEYGKHETFAQLFKVDSQDSSHDFLLVSLENIPNRNQNVEKLLEYLQSLRVEPAKLDDQHKGFPRLEIIWGPNGQSRGVKLANGKLTLWFNLIPSPEDDHRNWYSGSATSVLMDGREMLNYFTHPDLCNSDRPYWMCHDPEKRCMQIDQIQIWDEVNDCYSKIHRPFDQMYELKGQSIGPLGISITIASAPFKYRAIDEEDVEVRLYRIITLPKNAKYLIEELFVRREANPSAYFKFKAHYFTLMDTHWTQNLVSGQTGFAVISNMYPFPAYGFVSNTGIQEVFHPTPKFPHGHNEGDTFSWQLLDTQLAECLHIFALRQSPNDWLPQIQIIANNYLESFKGKQLKEAQL